MSVSNSFSSLSSSLHNITGDSSISQLGDPTEASSPKRMNHHQPRDKLRLLEIKFQSITNKSADLQMAIDSSQPDIIIGTKIWLTKDMNSSEFIPNDFEVFRRDRGSDPHGGVLIACRRSLVGSIVHIGKTTEFIGIKVKLIHGKKQSSYQQPIDHPTDPMKNTVNN